MGKDNKVYIKDWLNFKPYNKQVRTDFYYLKLCNKVLDVINKHENNDNYLDYSFQEEEKKEISCFLVSYFEDIISQTNIFPSFVRLHKKLYNKELPFYKVNEYFEDEINEADISFLLWYYISLNEDADDVVEFYDKAILQVSKDIMQIFEEEYEYAPENIDLKKDFTLSENSDYYELRNFMQGIFFNTYLFAFDTKETFTNIIEDSIKDKTDEKQIYFLTTEVLDRLLFDLHTKLLALKSYEWTAEIVGEKHPLYNDILQMGERFSADFYYRKQDENYIYLENISTEREFKVTKKSIDNFTDFDKKDSLIFMGLSKWQNEWWFSGNMYRINPSDEKEAIESAKEGAFLVPITSKEKEKRIEAIKNGEEAFKKFNNNSNIAFIEKGKVGSFINTYYEFYNNYQAKKQGLKTPKQNFNLDGLSEYDDINTIVFYNPKSGIEIAFDVLSAFPAKENKYFDQENSYEDTDSVLYSDSISKELTNYCIDNFKDKLIYFKNEYGKIVLENSDFILRFWKSRNYYSKPSVAST